MFNQFIFSGMGNQKPPKTGHYVDVKSVRQILKILKIKKNSYSEPENQFFSLIFTNFNSILKFITYVMHNLSFHSC